MKAFVMKQIGEVGWMEKPMLTNLGSNDAIIKPTVGLVCTSDVHTVEGAIGERKDLTLGHEVVGIVHKVGTEVKNVKVGDRVAVGAITPCFKCENCQRGFTSQCTEMLGGWRYSNIKDGTFAEYVHVNDAEANLAIIPSSVSDESAVYTVDMMTTGFMASENANIPLGGTVVIFGQGSVGLMATAGARLLGAGLIIAVENVTKRQKLAKNYGADAIIDFTKVNVLAEIMKLTKGKGVDSSIDAVGSQLIFENCIRATRPGGTISNVGYHSNGDYVMIPRLEWGAGMAGKTIKTGLCPGGKERLERLLRLIELGKIDPTPMTTHKFKFSELERAFQLMETKEDGVIKPLINY